MYGTRSYVLVSVVLMFWICIYLLHNCSVHVNCMLYNFYFVLLVQASNNTLCQCDYGFPHDIWLA